MDILTSYMNFSSFWTLWFWLTHVIVWTLAAHVTMGVPFDMIAEANREKREDGPWATAAEAIIQAQVFRYSEIFTRYGVALTGAAMFLLAVVITLGTYAGVELGLALATLLVPMTLIYAGTFRLALTLRAHPQSGQELRDRIRQQRLYNQMFGLLGAASAVGLAVVEALDRIQPA